jgi:hypothetical protein
MEEKKQQYWGSPEFRIKVEEYRQKYKEDKEKFIEELKSKKQTIQTLKQSTPISFRSESVKNPFASEGAINFINNLRKNKK